MGNYDNAVRDLKVSLCMEQSISGKKQIEDEINLILDQHNVKDSSPNVAKVKDSNINGIIFTYTYTKLKLHISMIYS